MSLKFRGYLQRKKSELLNLHDDVIESVEERKICSLKDVSELDATTIETTEQLFAEFEEFQAWQQKQASLSFDIPTSIQEKTTTPSQLSFLGRLSQLFATCENPAREQDWETGLQLWEGCTKLAWSHTICKAKPIDMHHPKMNQFMDLLGKQDICSDIPAHRWFGLLRGEQEGVLSLNFQHPTDKMHGQIAVYRRDWDSSLSHRSNDSLLQELVLGSLNQWLRNKLLSQSESHIRNMTAQTYRNLIETEPFKPEGSFASIFLSARSHPVGLLIVSEQGEILDSTELKINNNLLHTIKAWLGQFSIQHVVFPIHAKHMQTLQKLLNELSKLYDVQRVREAGIRNAKKYWAEEAGIKGPTASALVLAKRLLQPAEEWTRIDPLELGLVEYQEFLDGDRLRDAMQLEIHLKELGIRRKTIERMEKKQKPVTSNELNPLVKKIEDLRPGMALDGVVSNITNFGAFVQFGLDQDGLVHLSELDEKFVRHPSEVVQTGQTVKVYVLQADPQSKRISLTMKTPNLRSPKSSERPPRSQRQQSLQALENLFKN